IRVVEYSLVNFFVLSSIDRHAPTSTLFPYTTLFRSGPDRQRGLPLGQHRLGHAPGSRGLAGVPDDRPADGAGEGARRQRPSCSRSEEHTSELQSQSNLVCRLLLEKKNKYNIQTRARP